MRTLDQFRGLSPAARLLVVNQFGVNLGFYLVLPFLAGYLTDDLGFGAALVGLVLGMRVLSQQGLFLLGGSAADRLGCRPVIILGCGLRVVAFGLFALVTAPAGVVVATALTGLAGALFNPAGRAYLTHEAGERRAEAFALFHVAGHAGALAGPLLGALLLPVGFRVVAAVAGVVFAVLTVAQILVLPARPVEAPERGVLGSWWELARNRRFVAFTLCGSAYFALYNQLYLVLPLEAQRVTGSPAAITAVFVVSTVIGIALQVRIVAYCRSRWDAGTSLAVGLALMGAGFVPLAVAAPLLPAGAGPAAVLPVLVGTVVFTAGAAIADPFVMQLLPVVGDRRLVGTSYALFYLVSALVAAGVAAVAGGLLDLAGSGWRWTPGALLVAVGLAGAAGIAALRRRGMLAAAVEKRA